MNRLNRRQSLLMALSVIVLGWALIAAVAGAISDEVATDWAQQWERFKLEAREWRDMLFG